MNPTTSDREQLIARLNGHGSPDDPLRPETVELAIQEGVHLLLAHRLGIVRCAEDDAGAPLAAAARVAAIEDLRRSTETARVIARLESAGCAPVVMKGAALGHTHYPVSWVRPRLDTDVLVAPESRTLAARVFADLGYARPTFVEGTLVMYQEMFVRSERDGLTHVFDVHWRVSNAQVVSRALSHEELRAQAMTLSLHATPVKVPCPVHALLLACVHRSAHHHDAEHLLWLYDIHLLASRLTGDEWRAWRSLAIARGVARLCHRGLALASAAFPTHVPMGVTDAWLVAEAEPSAVFLRPDMSRAERLWSDLRALSAGDRLRLVAEILFPSPDYMRAAFGAGGWLPWLYVRRALRGVGKWLRPVRPAAS